MSLPACPDSPNCVSSLSTDETHYIEPFSYADAPTQAWDRLKAAVLSGKRVTLIEDTGTYLHVEVRSLIFRFTDDVEFLLLDKDKLIHVRSASRTGHSDFGVNRRRVEQIRTRFNQE
ncbi:MAG: DUF1499 domain-containing protein [Pseudomonadota bacterium]